MKLIRIGISITILASIFMLTVASQAANPLDAIASQVSKQAYIAQQNSTQNAVEHFVQGNLTQEHLQQDINSTKVQIKQRAEEIVKQQVNNTTAQIQQKAQEEINKQVNKSFQQPGFELVFALMIVLLTAYLLRRFA